MIIALRSHINRIKRMGNRSRIEIASDVLEAANGGASKIEIMYRALLSYMQMKEYVNFLSEKSLLAYDYQQGEVQTFKTTEKGLRFLEIYDRLDEMIKEEVQQQVPPLQFQRWIQRKKA